MRKQQRFFQPTRGGNVKHVILDPLNGYATVSYRRSGTKIHRQLHPFARYNHAGALVARGLEGCGYKTPPFVTLPKMTVQKLEKMEGKRDGKGVTKEKISKSISKILRGGALSSL